MIKPSSTARRLLLAAIGLLLLVAAPLPVGAATPLKGSFSLIDEEGRNVTLESYRGKFLLIYFGYTYCPDVCPTNLGIMTAVLEQLPPESVKRITPLFITIDPKRDTVEYVKDYTEIFHPNMIGLTGSAEAVAEAARTFGVYYAVGERNEEMPEVYMVDHSSNTFFLDPQGRLLKTFDHATPPDVVIPVIEKALAASPHQEEKSILESRAAEAAYTTFAKAFLDGDLTKAGALARGKAAEVVRRKQALIDAGETVDPPVETEVMVYAETPSEGGKRIEFLATVLSRHAKPGAAQPITLVHRQEVALERGETGWTLIHFKDNLEKCCLP